MALVVIVTISITRECWWRSARLPGLELRVSKLWKQAQVRETGICIVSIESLINLGAPSPQTLDITIQGGGKAGIWHSGMGLAADTTKNRVFLVTGYVLPRPRKARHSQRTVMHADLGRTKELLALLLVETLI